MPSRAGRTVSAPSAAPSGERPREVVLALDVGTTAVKVVAVGVDRPWRHLVEREYPLSEPHPGWQVQDADEVARACLSALTECVTMVGPDRVLGLALSTAMHGLVGISRDGLPTTPVITWADARASDEARALRDTTEGRLLHHTTGTPVHPMTPLLKLRWFGQHSPETTRATARWLDLKAFIVLRLTGRAATELSSASGSGLLDIRHLTWFAPALEYAGTTADRLPDLLSPTATLPLAPDVATATGLPSGLPVVLGGADGPLGNLGTGATRPSGPGLSLGTSGALRMVVHQPPDTLDPALFCYVLTESTWVVGGAVSNGGIVIRWAGELLTPGIDDDAAMLALAEGVAPGSDGLVVLPYLLSERAPLWDPDVEGAVLGLRRRHGRGHLVRATVEGVAMQLSAVLSRLEALHPVEVLRGTGGTLRSPLWRAVLADALGRPIEVSGAAEGTAVGAAALGLVGLGRAEDPLAARDVLADPSEDTPEVHEPDPARVAVYAGLRERTADLLDRLAPVRAFLTEDINPRATPHPATEVTPSP